MRDAPGKTGLGMALLVIGLLLNSQVISENPIEAHTDWQRALPGLMEQHNVPGVSVAILERGKLANASAFGVLRSGEEE